MSCWAITLSCICILLLNGQDDKKIGVCGSGPWLAGLPLVPTMQEGLPPPPGILMILLNKWGKEAQEVRTLPAITALDADSGLWGPAQPARLVAAARHPGPQIWASGHPFPVVWTPPSPHVLLISPPYRHLRSKLCSKGPCCSLLCCENIKKLLRNSHHFMLYFCFLMNCFSQIFPLRKKYRCSLGTV